MMFHRNQEMFQKKVSTQKIETVQIRREGTPAKNLAIARFDFAKPPHTKKVPENLRPFYFWGIGELAENQLANLNTSPSKFFQIIKRKNFR